MLIRQHLVRAAKKLPPPVQRSLQRMVERRREAARAKAVLSLVGQVALESPPCAICGGREIVAHTVFNGFKIVRCRNDGLIFTSPRPIDVAPFYDERYYKGEALFGYGDYTAHADGYAHQWSSRLEALEQDTPKHDGARLLDVGCATGNFLKLARSRGWDVAGIELSEWAVRTANEDHNLRVLQGSLPDPRVPSADYDVVTIFGCIEHLSDPRVVLQDIRRALKPEGLLMLSTGVLQHEDPHRVSKWYYPPWHLYYFSEQTIRALLSECGFEVISYEEQDRHVPEYALMLVVARPDYSKLHSLPEASPSTCGPAGPEMGA